MFNIVPLACSECKLPMSLFETNCHKNVSCSSVAVSKHGLYADGPGSIPTTVTTMTAAGGDAEHVSLNH